MRIGFCDDDKAFLELLASYCKESLPYIDYDGQVDVECLSSGEEILESYRRNKPYDILFLDLKMKPINGFETARQIRMFDNQVIIIFVTSLTDYVLKSFEYKPFWYLIKPVTQKNFKNVFMKAVAERLSANRAEYLFRTKAEGVMKLNVGSIIYLESQSRRIRLHTVDSDYYFYSGMNEEEEKLSRYDFIRVHKSYLVNPQYIKQINRTWLVLKDGERLPVSERRYKAVFDFFTDYMARSSLK
ncbi:LytR/AlgR family response regulator transcription factor [Thermoclostridium caenicola]|uniref:Stage 0 sporulation protein A homolog n=1 Tax=Thermoclostridium caenicola TaxID=659425 RepID=A0A1M6C5W2_9FIRM|nr:LytTR family DNA-binding domain-containing protein [Thermoclostridium caenicola]SHI56415.1 two component transcriptional regulator, LytTR family [Thermoclostridium caenicola]HOP73293.1 LytTR family DNA-binding domain-containing protein [Thermoclostridium caenicola]